ncbi:hypothetical protein BGX38DRAFT_1143701 [Terfezia claveryi]|nr:hypothetical protein BGX38DRAFT_1143701 [Terfezia claveryi]
MSTVPLYNHIHYHRHSLDTAMVYGQNLPWRNLGPAAVRARGSGGAGVSSTLTRRSIGALPMVRSVSTIRQLSSGVLAAERRASIVSTPTVGRGGLISLRETFSTLAPPGGLKRDRRKDEDEDAKEAESKRSLEKGKDDDKSGKKKDKKQKTEVAKEWDKKRAKKESKAVAPGEGTSPKDRTALRLHPAPPPFLSIV